MQYTAIYQAIAHSLAVEPVAGKQGGLMGFSPKSLFASGSQGAWYDPSDYTTLFEDSAGTIPITTPLEKPVGLMLDKSKGLVLGSELVTNGDFSQGATGWTAINGNGTVVDGKFRVEQTGGGYILARTQISGLTVGRSYKVVGTFATITNGANSQVWVGTALGAQDLNLNRSGVATGAITAIFTAGATTRQVEFVVNAAANAVMEIDNISVRELPGNHAYQSTTTSRPTLSARYNQITQSQNFAGSDWVKSGISVSGTKSTAPDGTQTAETLVWESGSSPQLTRLAATTVGAGSPLVYSLYAKAGTKSSVTLIFFTDGSNYAQCSFNLATGAVGSIANSGSQYTSIARSMTIDSNGFYRCVLSANTNTLTSVQTWIRGDTMVGSGDTITIWGADLRVANDGIGLPAYQRVDTATSYDYAGFPPYLKFDGTDDSMATGSIDFTATDKMFVAAGVRKLSEGSYPIISELSSSWSANNGTFTLSQNLNNGFVFGSRGTSSAAATNATFVAPISSVVTGIGNIASDQSILRINGTQAAISSGDQGTGNFGNYPLYIGQRGGVSYPFNGRLYSLVVVGKLASATEISSTEAWVNQKTRAF